MQQKMLCLKSLNKYTEAVAVGQDMIEKYPNDNRWIIELASCYQYLSNWDKSIECYDRLINNDPDNTYFRMQRADIYTRLNKYATALDEYKILVASYNMDNMLRKVALCYDKLNVVDSAKVYYNKTLDHDFFDVASVSGLINLNIKLGKSGFRDAIRLSDSYVKRDSVNQQMNLLNALTYYAADLYEGAVGRFEKCYNKGDSSLVVLRSMGLCYYSLGKRDDAYTYLQKAYSLDSTNINVLYALGVVANEKSDFDTGLKCFGMLIDKVIPADFTQYQYYRNMAIAYEGKNRYEDAVDYYKRAVEFANNNQKLYLYFSILSIYDADLKLPDLSLKYYELYQQSLVEYYEGLLKLEDPNEADGLEINVTRNKLDALDKYIKRLRKSLGLVGLDNVKVSSTIEINL